MPHIKPEFVTLAVGVLTALALLRYIPKVSGIFRWLLVFGIIAQIITQTVLFAYAEISASRQRASDREYASFLFILMTDDPVLLQRYLSKNLYALAYRDFRSGRYPKAEQEFEELIAQGRFVTQSHYLLARMSQLAQLQTPQPDYSEARAHLDAAINADHENPAPLLLTGHLGDHHFGGDDKRL